MIFWAILVALSALIIIVVVNRLRQPDYKTVEVDGPEQALGFASNELRVLTWNIGYGALGKDADFFMDGGRSLRPTSRDYIEKAAHQIGETLAGARADVLCIQELAQSGFLTRGVNVRQVIDEALSDRQRYFWADLKSVLFPPALRFLHGMGTYASKDVVENDTLNLPDADTLFLGFLKKPYAGLITRLPIAGSERSWVVINIHLPVYGATAEARSIQLRRLFEVASGEFARGNFVVIGGDWNMRLCDTDFPHTMAEKDLLWAADFPQDSTPDGWQIAIDPKVPTVRSLISAFEKDVNYTTIFDGFLVTPNVHVESVTTHDLDFEFADHQPVAATLIAKN